MAKYRLVKGAGPHKQSGVVYRAGDVVENAANLAAIFPGKFELIEGSAPAGEDRTLESHTPYDNARTKKSAAIGHFAATEEELPEDEQPLEREEVLGSPAESAGGVEEEESEEPMDEEVEEAPAPRPARKTATVKKKAATGKGR
jgi:hypothetical protein